MCGHINHRGIYISTWIGCVIQGVGGGLCQILRETMFLLMGLTETTQLCLGLILSKFSDLLLGQGLGNNIRVQDTGRILIINDIGPRIVIGGLRCTCESSTSIRCFYHYINVVRYLLLSVYIIRARLFLLINNGNFLIICTALHIIQKFLEI